MNVLITGANGFLGSYLRRAFPEHYSATLGLSGCNYDLDLSTTIPIFTSSFSTVIHAAGLAHMVPRTYKEGRLFYNVNVNGTQNLLRGLEKLPFLPEQMIFISTVAVYGVETGEKIDEKTPLKGNSPYALSKIEAENILQKWGLENNVRVLILRLPLLAGQNPPGNLGAMIKAIKKGYYFRIGNGSARRSVVLADDIANLISSGIKADGVYNLTDGMHPSIKELDSIIGNQTGRRIKVIPYSLVSIAARIGDFIPKFPLNTMKLSKLTSTLTFADDKAREDLGWNPKPVTENLLA